MKIITYVITSCILGGILGMVLLGPSVFASDKVKCTGGGWQCYKDAKPMDVLDDLIDNDDTDIVETKLDQVERAQGLLSGGKPYLKFSDTLDSVRQNITIYLQWIAFLGLMFATLFLMISGLRLMFSPLSTEQASKVKTQMLAVLAGVLLITGFYYLIKIFLAVYGEIFVD